MRKLVRPSVFLFQKDLRTKDNRGLKETVATSEYIVPAFILDKKLYNKFQLDFLLKALAYLNKELTERKSKLFVISSDFETGLKEIKRLFNPQSIYTNRDFSWEGERKEKILTEFCRKNSVNLKISIDNFLVNPSVLKVKKVFTHFYNEWINYIDDDIQPDLGIINTPKFCFEKTFPMDLDFGLSLKDFEEGIKRMDRFNFANYDKLRNFLHIDGTSRLSPYINFGCISIRKLFRKVKNLSLGYLKELAFREFWYHIRIHFPQTKDLEFQEKRRNIKWINNNNQELIKKFENAETGYPIIDACVRALKKDGWLHNRGRMILASFLTKTLFVDWRIGESFFSNYLVDYDEVLNVHNWQWSASVGADPRPLRIFNPMIQSKKFDPECKFIKKYIPELKDQECKKIHDPIKFNLSYVEPVVNFYIQRDIAKLVYFNNQ